MERLEHQTEQKRNNESTNQTNLILTPSTNSISYITEDALLFRL